MTSCGQKNRDPESALPFPRIWTTYSVCRNYDEDFTDLKKHGVGAVVIGRPSSEVLSAARKHNMKILMEIEDITERAYEIDSSRVEKAVMMAGAYNGRAIDRFRFAFSPGPHRIVIENPIYDRINCYGDDLGHYFPGMKDPVKAEVIVKEADFDGQSHLNIIPATTKRLDEHHWQMNFDLTGVKGDLDQVVLAVYWTSSGSRKYWMFGDNASPFAASTKEAVEDAVKNKVKQWSDANGGSFPGDEIVAVCYGDECWNVTGHLNSDACSYPLWDYSETAIRKFEKDYPGQVYPRGKSWPDMFGRQAYAGWLYNYHKACADLAKEVKTTLLDLGINAPTYRNITRSNVFAVQNDQDGSGLDLLAGAFDITLIDPYPVTPSGYKKDTIPVDMNYVAGLSRRHHTWLVPWMQAHEYLPKMGFLVHPGPDDIARIITQHRLFRPDAAMWLGYGPHYTFPDVNPAAWEKAAEFQMTLFEDTAKIIPSFAAIRPYNVRALRDIDKQRMQDRYFTDFLFFASSDTLLYYDPFEPLSLSDLGSGETGKYPVIFAEAGSLSGSELSSVSQAPGKWIFYIEGADHYKPDETITGIKSFKGNLDEPLSIETVTGRIRITSLDRYELGPEADILLGSPEYPVIWRVDNNIFIAGRSGNDAKRFYKYWLTLM
jgi:hypothetical protein